MELKSNKECSYKKSCAKILNKIIFKVWKITKKQRIWRLKIIKNYVSELIRHFFKFLINKIGVLKHYCHAPATCGLSFLRKIGKKSSVNIYFRGQSAWRVILCGSKIGRLNLKYSACARGVPAFSV